MTATLRVALLTRGDPERMTGGHLYHRRMANAAPDQAARLAFVSIPDWPLPWALASGPVWRADPVLRDADVVVLDSLAAAAAAPWLGDLRAPVVAMLHQPPGGYGPPRERALTASFDRWAYRRCRLLLAASESLAERLIREGVRPARVRVVPPGKDVAMSDPTDGEPALAGERRRLRDGRRAAALCVASWLPNKGVLELLEAVARLPGDRLTLHLVGDDVVDPRYTRRVRRRLAQADLVDRVVSHGILPPVRVARLYRAVDLFALPSFEETYGVAWGEAMAAGLPVVGWRAGNLPFLASDGSEAVMVPTGNVVALSEAIERLACSESERLRIGRAAAERARVRPTWSDVSRQFFDALREVSSPRA